MEQGLKAHEDPIKKTMWWLMNRCRVHGRYDASRVGPSIEAALKKLIGEGPLTIYAIGDTRCVTNEDLNSLSSSGILIRDTPFGLEDGHDAMVNFALDDPSPGIRIIAADTVGLQFLRSSSNVDFIPVSSGPNPDPGDWLWKDLLETPVESKKSKILNNDKKDEPAFYCTTCERAIGIGIGSVHDLNLHLRSNLHNKKLRKKHKMLLAKRPPPQKVVWWDIDRCPIPDGYDPCCVSRTIESALYKSDGSGPVTIYATGDTRRIPDLLLKALASSGIWIKHAPFGLESIYDDMRVFASHNSPPATAPAIMMLITEMGVRFHNLLDSFVSDGFKVIRAYPCPGSDDWRWENLLKTKVLEELKEIKTVIPLPYICTVCKDCAFKSSSELHDHLSSDLHRENLSVILPMMRWRMPEDTNKTVVWWDTDGCPVPDGVDPSCVGLSIKSAVMESFGSGPVTIYAMGDMTRLSCPLKLGLSSAGVLIRHHDLGLSQMNFVMHYWEMENPPPANMVIITHRPHRFDMDEFKYCGYKTKHMTDSALVMTPVDVETSSEESPQSETLWLCQMCSFGVDTSSSFEEHLCGADHLHMLSKRRKVKTKI